MTCPSPDAYFLDAPLYRLHEFQGPDDAAGLVRIQFHTNSVDTYCVGCKQHSVFQSTQELPDVGPGVMVRTPAASVEELLKKRTALLPHHDDDASTVSNQNVIDYVRRPKYFESKFICSRDKLHELRFITRVSTDGFMKIGQYPALADLHLGDLQKYRKVLGSQYSELARGVGLFAHGVGIGAFVYLRRIFERAISEAHTSGMSEPGWDESLYQKARMDERIKLLERHLPSFIVENRSVYSIMSKGIHELAEEECLEYFPVVRVAIELTLDEKLEKIEKDKKVATTRSALGNIMSKMKGKGDAS
jgi:hypothetical protein